MRGMWGKRPQEMIDRGNELLDNFANMLTKRGIRVDRPTPTEFSLPATTPDFHTDSQFGCPPPRDVLLTVGNEILEATMSYRCHWFEYLCYRPLMQQYWVEDTNFRHEAAPKPRLSDKDYHTDYLSDKIGVEKRLKWAAEKFFVTIEEWLRSQIVNHSNKAQHSMFAKLDHVKANPQGQLCQRLGPGNRHLRLPCPAQHKAKALHMDQNSRAHPHPRTARD